MGGGGVCCGEGGGAEGGRCRVNTPVTPIPVPRFDLNLTLFCCLN